jgi:hypothetical protein
MLICIMVNLNIVRPFGIYILWLFGIFSPFLVYCTKKNLATLMYLHNYFLTVFNNKNCFLKYPPRFLQYFFPILYIRWNTFALNCQKTVIKTRQTFFQHFLPFIGCSLIHSFDNHLGEQCYKRRQVTNTLCRSAVAEHPPLQQKILVQIPHQGVKKFLENKSLFCVKFVHLFYWSYLVCQIGK